jgi:methylated-DNA-[protein]-cysteine S-methyltransferase
MSGRDYRSYDAIIRTPLPCRLSHLAIRVHDGKLQELVFVSTRSPLKTPTDPLARQVVKQLRCYFSDPTFKFDLPLNPVGTDFQKRVWRKLSNCPSGKVWSYGHLAQLLNSGARAIGGACRRNPIPVVVPCHRVVAQQGIGGYAGATAGNYLSIKHWLLQHESAI